MLLSGLDAGAYTDQDVLDRMREAVHRPVADETTGDLRPWPRDFSELRSSGLLWLINRQVFHPWGYGLGIGFDSDRVALGWILVGDGSEPMNFQDGPETSNVAAALATLGLVRA
jgi:hypothetical protein